MDNDYLSRPLIEDVTYLITEDRLQITDSCTIYAEAKPYIPLKKNAVLQLYAEVLCAAKKAGIKICYRSHFRRNLLENWTKYEKDCQKAKQLYDEMLSVAKEVQSRGLHYGTTDDSVLTNLQAVAEQYAAMFWRNQSISQVSEVQHHLESARSSLAIPNTGYPTIYL